MKKERIRKNKKQTKVLSSIFIFDKRVIDLERKGIELILVLDDRSKIRNADIRRDIKITLECKICNIQVQRVYDSRFFNHEYLCHKCKGKGYNSNKLNRTLTIKVDEKRGMLTIKKILWDRKPIKYLCECECGNFKEFGSSAFGSVKSCGCLSHKKRKDVVNFTGYEGIYGTYWRGVINRAKKFSSIVIPIEKAWNLWILQDGKCALSNIPIFLPVDSNTPGTASLDRIDSSKGYIEGNVQWIHKDINRMKNKYDQKYFINMCRLITEKDSISQDSNKPVQHL